MVTKNKGAKNARSHTKGKEEEKKQGKKEPKEEISDNLSNFIVHTLAEEAYQKIIDDGFEAENKHEEVEDELISKGFEYDQYGEYLDAKYKKKAAADGSDFLDDGKVDAEIRGETLSVKDVSHKEAVDSAAAHKKLNDELEAAQINVCPSKKTRLFNELKYTNGREETKPTPVKVREKDTKSSGMIGYTVWQCPKCKSPCNQIAGRVWQCSAANCFYGKPQPIAEDEMQKEITRYKLHMPELGCGANNVKMVYIGDGRYKVKEGQDEHIAKQVVKLLSRKPWNKLTGAQIKYLTEWDKTKQVTNL